MLVFHFSMQACQPCLEGIREIIKSEFPDYAKNKNIIFFSNDIENRLRKNFLGKQIISSLKKEDKLPINKYATPLLFTTDSNNIIQNVFIPDKDNIESLRNSVSYTHLNRWHRYDPAKQLYLKNRNNYSVNKRHREICFLL